MAGIVQSGGKNLDLRKKAKEREDCRNQPSPNIPAFVEMSEPEK